MSRSKHSKESVVPSWFKRLQMRSQKQKQKANDRKLFLQPEEAKENIVKKTHRWDYF